MKLVQNPFFILGATTRDDHRRILAMRENECRFKLFFGIKDFTNVNEPRFLKLLDLFSRQFHRFNLLH